MNELNETSQMDVTERWADGGRAVQSGCGWTWSDGLFQPGQFYGSMIYTSLPGAHLSPQAQNTLFIFLKLCLLQ